jgi:uncharacterized protein (TIGR02996 family)
MTEHDAMIAAILAQSADDTARLVFADWPEEHDEPERAAYIRDAVELARLEDVRIILVQLGDILSDRAGLRLSLNLTDKLEDGAEVIVASLPEIGEAFTGYGRPTRRAYAVRYVEWADGEMVFEPATDENLRRTAQLLESTSAGDDEIGVDILRRLPKDVTGRVIPFPRRGFIERLSCAGNDWARLGDTIRTLALIQGVTFNAAPQIEEGPCGPRPSRVKLMWDSQNTWFAEEEVIKVATDVCEGDAGLALCALRWP